MRSCPDTDIDPEVLGSKSRKAENVNTSRPHTGPKMVYFIFLT